MGFIIVLLAVTFCIAGSAAFFSIHGLAQIFTGAFWPVVVMATSLEAGKLVAASYVYRYWSLISMLMRTYLIAAIVVLMTITSAGIFGYLSGAYQQDVLELKVNEQKITQLQDQLEQYKELKADDLQRKDEIDEDIASLPNNYITARQRLLGDEGYGPELQQIKENLQQYNQQITATSEKITKLENKQLQQKVHTGPITFIAQVFGKEIDDTTKWLILLIIFAFDPLAVILVIGANVALLHKQESEPQLADDAEPEPTTTELTDIEELFEEPLDFVTEEQVINMINRYQHNDDTNEQLHQLLKRKQLQEQMRTSSVD